MGVGNWLTFKVEKAQTKNELQEEYDKLKVENAKLQDKLETALEKLDQAGEIFKKYRMDYDHIIKSGLNYEQLNQETLSMKYELETKLNNFELEKAKANLDNERAMKDYSRGVLSDLMNALNGKLDQYNHQSRR